VPSDAITVRELDERVDAVAAETRAATRLDPPPARGPDHRRWWLAAALVAGFLLEVGWRLWLARSVPTPVAHADEDRYLLSARVLAGGPGGLGNDTAAFRRMGYPILLAPIYSYTSNPFTVYHVAQAIGAVVNALTFPLAYLFGRRVLGLRRVSFALLLAFVAAALPAVVYYSEFALTDAILPPLVLAWLLLLHAWLRRASARSAAVAVVCAGAVAGYMYTVHVRGAFVLAVHLAALAVTVLARRRRWKVAVWSAVAALACTQLNRVAEHLVGDRLVTGGVEPQARILQRLTSAGGLVHTICDAIGQLWYAGVGTWGLAAIGLVVAVDRIRRRDVEGVDPPQRAILTVAVASCVLIALSSAAALPNDGRMSNHAYVRYIAFLMPVFVMVAVVALVRADRTRVKSVVGRAAAGIAVGGLVVLSQMTEVTLEWFHPFDTPEVSAMTNSWRTLPVAKATVVALVLLAVLAATLVARSVRYGPFVAVAGVLALCAGTMVLANAKAVGPMAAAEYRPASRLVQDLRVRPGDTVVSSKWVPLGARLNHQREVYWAPVAEFDDRTAGPPAAATVVIAPWKGRNGDWNGAGSGWRVVAADPVGKWAVWFRTADPRSIVAPFRTVGR
jgi:hypothetical protein